MSAFVGSWKMTEGKDVNTVLEKLGVNVVKRNLIATSKPEVTYSLVGNNGMSIKTNSILKTSQISFNFDEEFDEVTGDDRNVRTTFKKISENKLIQIQKHKDADTEIVREVDGDVLTVHITVDGVTAVVKYRRQS